MALFAEGIAGRPYHIKPLGELGEDQLADGAEASHDGRSLYLPDAIETGLGEALDLGVYRLRVLQQLGFREFGTYRFDLQVAGGRIPGLGDIQLQAELRESDLGAFFRSFPRPETARALFRVIETMRIRAAVERRYPGSRRYRLALTPAGAAALPFSADSLADFALSLDAALEAFPAKTPLLPLAVEALRPDADVYASASATVACYRALDGDLETAPQGDAGDGERLEWLQREARLEDWQEELQATDNSIAVLEFAAGADNIEAPTTEASNATARPADADLVAVRDRLKRRLDMERSSLRQRFGEERRGESYRYDEWDHLQGAYLRGWCRLYEERLQGDDAEASLALLNAVKPYAKSVRRRFEHIRPVGYQRVRKTPDGDELDLDAIVEARADIRNGASPDERVYSRRERLRRDVAAAFLVDLSASTDDIVPEERSPPVTAIDKTQDIRDPYFDEDDEYDFAARMAEDAAKRRIIDIQREAVLLMATALEGLGDRYGVYGFSGYGRDGVEFYVAKEFDQPFDQAVVDAIALMKPKRSTRMGPAIRHAAAKLQGSGAALKVLMIVSDGFPQDHDYGPHRGEREYGVQDTAKALLEAEGGGIETFCVTVDCGGDSSHDYLRRMCPQERYMVIEETRELPTALQKAYRQLTRI